MKQVAPDYSDKLETCRSANGKFIEVIDKETGTIVFRASMAYDKVGLETMLMELSRWLDWYGKLIGRVV